MTATISRLRTTLALQMALDSKRRAALMVELRDRADLTQDALALKSGVSERTIQRIENPDDDIEPRYATREKLAKVLKVKPDELLPEAVEPSTKTNGDTPDLMGTVNGDMPDDLQKLHHKLDLIIEYFGIKAKEDGHVVSTYGDAYEAIRPKPAKRVRKGASTQTGRGAA